MSQFLPLIRARLSAIATQAATAAEAIEADGDALDLLPRQLAELLFELDCAGAKITYVVERLGSALDPARIAGCSTVTSDG
jgi:hypothetical protein